MPLVVFPLFKTDGIGQWIASGTGLDPFMLTSNSSSFRRLWCLQRL